MAEDRQDIIIYNTVDGKAAVSLYAKDGMVWMNQSQLAELFDTSKQNIGQHVANILKEKELDKNSVVKNYFTCLRITDTKKRINFDHCAAYHMMNHMPKYRNKVRLKKYLSNHNISDKLIEFLILNDYPDKIIETVSKDGIDIFVTAWEESVEFIVADSDYEEYDYDLSKRTELCLVLQHTPPEQVQKFKDRIKVADELFKKATIETDEPHIKNASEKKDQWWLFRQLK